MYLGPVYNNISPLQLEGEKTYEQLRNEKRFNGLFVEYDWTEFAFYVGGALIVYFLVKVSNIQSND